MIIRHLNHIIFYLAVAMLAASACTNQKNLNTPTQTADTLMYYFRDMPNRSFRITVVYRKINFTIENHDSVLVKKTFRLSPKKHLAFVSAIDSLHLKSFRPARGNACIGGTSQRLILHPGTLNEVDGFISYCGSGSYGTLEGNVPAAAKLFRALIPNLEKRIEATEE